MEDKIANRPPKTSAGRSGQPALPRPSGPHSSSLKGRLPQSIASATAAQRTAVVAISPDAREAVNRSALMFANRSSA